MEASQAKDSRASSVTIHGDTVVLKKKKKKKKKPSVLCRIKNHLQVSISSIQKNHLQAKCMGNYQWVKCTHPDFNFEK